MILDRTDGQTDGSRESVETTRLDDDDDDDEDDDGDLLG